MDVQMPEMDGYEATAQIRRRESQSEGPVPRRTPIIAMTANAMQGDREKALEAGMDDYVPKPFNVEELDAVLERWIPQNAASGPKEQTTDDATASTEAIEPLNQSVLEALRELGDADLLTELVDLFFADVPPQLASLREAMESGDASSVKRVAHTLKGSCGNMGAQRIAAICVRLQDIGASGDLAHAPELLKQLEAEFGRVRPALEVEIAKG